LVVIALLLACAGCHPKQAATQSRTAHARALSFAGGRWAFGAGVQAITYVSQIDEDHYLEHGQSWYKRSNGLALTPGHHDAQGVRYRTFAPDAAILRCFGCHSTGRLTLGAGRAVQPAEPGVRCEACHGPGAEHTRKPSAANIVSPKRMTPAQISDLCGRCHRMPPAGGVETNWVNPWNVRHQPVYLSQSACFLKSGKLSCVNCHDPHEDRSALRDGKCAECHSGVRHRTKVAGQSCVACHMPVVRPSPLLAFTNHWIGIYRSANRLRPLAKPPGLGAAAGLLQ
jgi:hypothetical protein